MAHCLNQRGEVVGVNSRIFSGTGGYMGCLLSIPIDVAMDVVQQLKTNGKGNAFLSGRDVAGY